MEFASFAAESIIAHGRSVFQLNVHVILYNMSVLFEWVNWFLLGQLCERVLGKGEFENWNELCVPKIYTERKSQRYLLLFMLKRFRIERSPQKKILRVSLKMFHRWPLIFSRLNFDNVRVSWILCSENKDLTLKNYLPFLFLDDPSVREPISHQQSLDPETKMIKL